MKEKLATTDDSRSPHGGGLPSAVTTGTHASSSTAHQTSVEQPSSKPPRAADHLGGPPERHGDPTPPPPPPPPTPRPRPHGGAHAHRAAPPSTCTAARRRCA
eukprot:TRINITY_DN272_c0_g1_i17.p3 TRINITY_DN272_c0_g1~~TRINITY_DN272_c0_g1_i17.p3  ORF type:complete len:102 (+),score=0.76 TRINITY_DN272_c0_g1_i17:233-538(+)